MYMLDISIRFLGFDSFDNFLLQNVKHYTDFCQGIIAIWIKVANRIYRDSPLSTVSISTVPGLVRFSNSTKSADSPV